VKKSGKISLPGRLRRGFTLLELVIVLVILTVAFSVVWPRLPRLASTERSEALRRIAYSAEAVYEQAAFKKKA
jgi:prepilin-type N-terminal cleavage/methylation domain-containing protein